MGLRAEVPLMALRLIAELNQVLQVWGKTPPNTVVVAMPKTTAMPLLHALMTKMRVFGSADWKRVALAPGEDLPGEQVFERYFADLTHQWQTDYAFIARYENESRPLRELLEDDRAEPTSMALIDRWSVNHARWLYIIGGHDPNRPRVVLPLLREIGIREIESHQTPNTSSDRLAVASGAEQEELSDGRKRSIVRLDGSHR